MDSGLQSLALIAQVHQIAVDVAQLLHQFGSVGQPCQVIDILCAVKSIGFKAKSTQVPLSQLIDNTLPAIACAQNGTIFILAKVDSSVGKLPLIL